MLTIPGVYRKGQIELSQQPSPLADETPVLVTFLAASPIELAARGIDPSEAADLRSRLTAFAEEWSSPEMAEYDDYDARHQQLEAR